MPAAVVSPNWERRVTQVKEREGLCVREEVVLRPVFLMVTALVERKTYTEYKGLSVFVIGGVF